MSYYFKAVFQSVFMKWSAVHV